MRQKLRNPKACLMQVDWGRFVPSQAAVVTGITFDLVAALVMALQRGDYASLCGQPWSVWRDTILAVAFNLTAAFLLGLVSWLVLAAIYRADVRVAPLFRRAALSVAYDGCSHRVSLVTSSGLSKLQRLVCLMFALMVSAYAYASWSVTVSPPVRSTMTVASAIAFWPIILYFAATVAKCPACAEYHSFRFTPKKTIRTTQPTRRYVRQEAKCTMSDTTHTNPPSSLSPEAASLIELAAERARRRGVSSTTDRTSLETQLNEAEKGLQTLHTMDEELDSTYDEAKAHYGEQIAAKLEEINNLREQLHIHPLDERDGGNGNFGWLYSTAARRNDTHTRVTTAPAGGSHTGTPSSNAPAKPPLKSRVKNAGQWIKSHLD